MAALGTEMNGGGIGSALANARALYRKLPVGLRMTVGRALMRSLETALRARLASADPAAAGAVDAAQILGLFRAPVGHGKAAWLLDAELAQAGVATQRLDASEALGAPLEHPPLIAAERLDAHAALILVMNPESAVHALTRLGPNLLCGRRVVGYWVWETERAPESWRKAARLVHDIWAPSAFAAHAIEQVVERKVDVAPHPAALAAPAPVTPERRAAVRSRLRGRRLRRAHEFLDHLKRRA